MAEAERAELLARLHPQLSVLSGTADIRQFCSADPVNAFDVTQPEGPDHFAGGIDDRDSNGDAGDDFLGGHA